MNWFNYYGLIAVAVILLPNIAYSITYKGGDVSTLKWWAIAENIGRYGCMAFIIFNIPYTWHGYFFASGQLVYLIAGGALLAAYLIAWAIFWKRQTLAKALSLSILPSALFLFAGFMIVSIPFIVCAVLFSVAHIYISVKTIPQRDGDFL